MLAIASPAYFYFYREIAAWLGDEGGQADRAKALLGIANRTTSSDHWFTAPSGRVGFILILSIIEEFARVECYIRLKNAQDVENKEVFMSFLTQREAIEKRFGEPLEWQELPNRLGCRICKTLQGSWHLPQTEWGPLQDQMIDVLIRLEAALHDPIRLMALDKLLANSSS